MFITVVLHTSNGDVRTAYPPGSEKYAYMHILQYMCDGKSFSVEQSEKSV